MVKFGVSFSRGVKNRGYLFPKMPYSRVQDPQIEVKVLKSVPQTFEITQIGSIFGVPDAPARDESESLGWSIHP